MAKTGEAFIAPEGHDMKISGRRIVGRERSQDGTTLVLSINVMMKSIECASRPKTRGVFLTGMRPSRREPSSLARAMPKVVVRTGVVDLVAHIVDRQARIANAIEVIVARSLAIE